jgi:hypothetical protein
MMTYYRAWENQRFVRGLLREKQPELAAALDAAVREPPCLRCDRSRCAQADESTLPRPAKPRRHLVPAGNTVAPGAPPGPLAAEDHSHREFSERGVLPRRGVFDKSHNHLTSSARCLVIEATYSI